MLGIKKTLTARSISEKSNLFKKVSSIALLSMVGIAGGVNAEVGKQLIVKYKSASAAASEFARAQRVTLKLSNNSEAQLVKVLTMAKGEQVLRVVTRVSDNTFSEIISQIANNPAVQYVEKDLIMRASFTPNDTLYADQWHYHEAKGGMNLPDAWDYGQGEGVVVAVLDTGYRPHSDLVGNILPGYDFVSDPFVGTDGDGRDSDPKDTGDAMQKGECGDNYPPVNQNSSWHGTHVAGTVAAVSNNGKGVAGVAPKAKVVPVRVLGKCGGHTSDITDAIRWAAGLPVPGVPNNPNPAKVINMSLGSSEPEQCTSVYSSAIADARAAGAIVVLAAGNSSKDAGGYPPGNCPGAFTVAATNRNGGRASYSNYGKVVSLAAPGGAQIFPNDSNGVLSTHNDGAIQPGSDKFTYMQGTSMAAPHAAGAAALLFGLDKNLKPVDVENALKSTARAFAATCNNCGTGIIDSAAAAKLIVDGPTEPQDSADLMVELTGNNGKHVPEGSAGLGRIKYIATVTNAGPKAATNTVMKLSYPSQVKVDVIKPAKGVCHSGGAACDLGTLAIGASVKVEVEVLTSATTVLNFGVSATSDISDANPKNNSATAPFGGALVWMLGLISAIGVLRMHRRPS